MRADFLNSRIVFWEDDCSEFSNEVATLTLDGASVVVVHGNEFAVKRRVLLDEPETKFLLYRAGGAPEKSEDFLLDIKLASPNFSNSRAAEWAQECGVPAQYEDVLATHGMLFEDAGCKARLKKLFSEAEWLGDGVQRDEVELALLAVACGVEAATQKVDAWRQVARAVVEGYALGTTMSWDLIKSGELKATLWRALQFGFGYTSDEPGVPDFALACVTSACVDVTGDTPTLNTEASVLLSEMSQNTSHRAAFEELMRKTQGYLEEKYQLHRADRATLINNPYLPQVDRWVCQGLSEQVANGLDCVEEIRGIVAKRKFTPWYGKAEATYKALAAATALITGCKRFDDNKVLAESASDVLERYISTWYDIDSSYRHFHEAAAEELLCDVSDVRQSVEPRYGRFLADLAVLWQDKVCEDAVWPPMAGVALQRRFFKDIVMQSYGERVAVIVSDALRYEVGAELADLLKNGSPRYQAALMPMFAMAPTYTQLGMAALLPGDELGIDIATQDVTVDGMSSNGTENRKKLLARADTASLCVQASNLTQSAGWDQADIIYVYRNGIDNVGHEAEGEVFTAVSKELKEIRKLVKKLLAASYDTVHITGDHGFLYQDGDPTGFQYVDNALLSAAVSAGDGSRTRRFALGTSLHDSDQMIRFSSKQLGLSGTFDVWVPKGIRRMRLQGSGARFVHGGITLEECVVPVITVVGDATPKKRRPVGVQVLKGGKSVISGNALKVKLYQTEPVGDVRTPLHLRVGLYDEEGNAASTTKQLDLTSESKDDAARISEVELVLSSGIRHGATLTLKVEGRWGATSSYTTRDTAEYRVRRPFGNDFR